MNDTRQIIADTLLDFGIPDRLIGFPALVEAIMLYLDDNTVIHRTSKSLYPAVAKKFGKNASQTERAIRHAIEVGFSRADTETVKKYFANTVNPNKGKSTNCEFIARIGNYVNGNM